MKRNHMLIWIAKKVYSLHRAAFAYISKDVLSRNTVEHQWLEHLCNQLSMFETGAVQANDNQNARSGSKLENWVCKTQVMPPCPKPVLTPCPILTHDPQHIQSILEANVWNVKVKTAVILSKIIFLCAKKNKQKKHAHLQYAFNSCAKFQNECLKILR